MPTTAAALQVQLRLVVQHEFVALQRVAQRALDAHPLQRFFVHGRLVELGVVAAHFLGAVHGDVGVLDQALAGVPSGS
jgi:hypothetical protein